jgi:hypothetical protein
MDSTNNSTRPYIKTQNNSFANFPMPIYDIDNTNILQNSTGFNSDNIIIHNLSGKATSILENNGFEFYLSSLKNGMFLSDINIITTDFIQLKQYLECLPRNLNGYKLNIVLNNTSEIPKKNLDGSINQLEISNFYGRYYHFKIIIYSTR